MKKIVFIIVCAIGIICFTCCRSVSKPCGIANNASSVLVSFEQVDIA